MLSLWIFVSFYLFFSVVVMHTEVQRKKATARLEESQSTGGTQVNLDFQGAALKMHF